MRADTNTSTVGQIATSGGIFGSNSAGNFHLDSDKAKADGRIYLNWFNGKGVVIGNGAQAPLAIFDANLMNVPGLGSIGPAGPCCSGIYTLSIGEATTTTGRPPTLQFHAAGAVEGQLLLTTPAYAPNGQGVPALARRSFVLQSVQGPIDLVVSGNIRAGGNKNFVHPHPDDPTKQIVYVALEGGEAGTYARGTASLAKGRARVPMPDHFALVTSQAGVTAQVTPRGRCGGLYVASATPREIVVESEREGASCSFDWLVQGVRRGHEGHQVFEDVRPSAIARR
jgi:hypothetical protein